MMRMIQSELQTPSVKMAFGTVLCTAARKCTLLWPMKNQLERYYRCTVTDFHKIYSSMHWYFWISCCGMVKFYLFKSNKLATYPDEDVNKQEWHMKLHPSYSGKVFLKKWDSLCQVLPVIFVVVRKKHIFLK